MQNCKQQAKVSREAKENDEYDCTRDWDAGRFWQCNYVEREESCKDYSEEKEIK